MLQLSHKQLEVYQIALKLIQEVYMLTKAFPSDEKYVLVSQLKRASVSVCSNIAEGSARISKIEKKRFYEIARSSIVEIDTQIEISLLNEYLTNIQIIELEKYLESIFRMLSKMINNLENKSSQ
jgi:four helix bundle protein